jgi:hypothetical protein
MHLLPTLLRHRAPAHAPEAAGRTDTAQRACSGARALLLSAALLLAGTAGAQGPATAADAAAVAPSAHPAQQAWRYTAKPALAGVTLSPSGKRAAMLINDGKRPTVLAVLDLPPTQPPRVVAAHDDAPVRSVFWVNDDRLVYDAYVPSAQLLEGEGGKLAVNHDGTDRRLLITLAWAPQDQTGSRIGSNRPLTLHWDTIGPAPGGNGREILVRQGNLTATGEWANGRIARLDTETGQLSMLGSDAPSGAHTWVFDAQGQPRALRLSLRGRDQVHIRPAAGGPWVQVSDLPLNDPAAMHPLFLEPDGQLIVSTRAGQDTAGLYVYDLSKRRLDPEPLARVNRFDIEDVITDEAAQSLTGVRVLADREHTVWFSERMARLQKSLDASLPPGRINRLHCNRCETSAYYAVYSHADNHPGEYLVLDPASGKLTSLGLRLESPAHPHPRHLRHLHGRPGGAGTRGRPPRHRLRRQRLPADERPAARARHRAGRRLRRRPAGAGARPLSSSATWSRAATR